MLEATSSEHQGNQDMTLGLFARQALLLLLVFFLLPPCTQRPHKQDTTLEMASAFSEEVRKQVDSQLDGGITIVVWEALTILGVNSSSSPRRGATWPDSLEYHNLGRAQAASWLISVSQANIIRANVSQANVSSVWNKGTPALTVPYYTPCHRSHIVLGASGDLAKKKTFPALFGLYRNGFFPKKTSIVGYSRTKMTHEEYHKRVSQYIKIPEAFRTQLNEFLAITTYIDGQYDEDESYQKLNSYIEKIENDSQITRRNRLFYMALPPSVFIPVAQGLKKNVYSTDAVIRVVVEKPFGMDLESSRHLGKELGALFSENEIYRIDHYLGKEMVKNIMTLRFANVFFGSIWNSQHIDNVQITFKEPFGTEGRGGYFDEFGIIRDVMQNHLFQVLSLLAMERPISMDAEAIRDEKVKVLRCIPPIVSKDTLLGQYGKSEDGIKPGYLEDDTLKNKKSVTPTFATLVAWINNERWHGVPFILKAGKALDESKVEVRIQFKNVAGQLFKEVPRNELVVRVQPNEAVYMKFNNKLPGLSFQTTISELDLTYQRRYSDLRIPDAYEALILDVLRGDHSNFVRDDELDAAWTVFTPLLREIDSAQIKPNEYVYGTRGPQQLDDFVKGYGFRRHQEQYVWPIQNVSGAEPRL
ncbi:glucose-6-phosphate dehydrogenase [Endogone sp. FLAS-F59071]|nr:glucose-6-phosphate dehydrogenase [Endogone sp. FLAS-F59071]|eukprot:RUS19470.1 glucose-6-phosphate dehydrogenase [Endogone sp. FLAS-F59071]